MKVDYFQWIQGTNYFFYFICPSPIITASGRWDYTIALHDDNITYSLSLFKKSSLESLHSIKPSEHACATNREIFELIFELDSKEWTIP